MTTSRPQLALDGQWNLRAEAFPEGRTVTVPGAWTTQVAGFEMSHDTVHYSRTFTAPTDWADENAVLLFGGVNHRAEVSLNGTPLGSHVGGWTPFELPVGDALVAGENLLEVTVSYPPRMRTAQEPGFTEIPHGKQSWYGPSAGIWQSVTLEARAAQHIRSARVRADAETGTLSATVVLAEPAIAATTLTLSVPGQAPVDVPVAAGSTELVAAITVVAPIRWSPENPHRYTLTLSVGADSVAVTTGFRTVEARDGEILLNGEAVEIRAVLDQDYHPGSSTIPESDEALEALFRETKRLGFTMLRCHIKRPDARYYELADRLGLLVWTELPSWLTMTERGAAEGADLLEEIIGLDAHHPSIIMWTVMNESWGIDLRDADQRAWLRASFDRIKALAPESLIVDNSACEPNFHLKSDIDDFHVYRGIPESRVAWDEKIAEFAGRPDWTFSPYGDAERTGTEPLLLSEYGNWSLPHALDQFGDDGSEPWWFANGAHWAFGAAEGTGLEQRFIDLGLRDAFGSWDALVTALHRAQMIANRYQTGSIRSHAEIAGYVLTQLSDVQWEANGLFDMNRTPKRFTEEFRLINGPHAVVLRPERSEAVIGGELAVTATTVAPRPLGDAGGAVGEVRFSVSGVVQARVSARLDARENWSQTLTLPALPGEYEVAAELWRDDELLARDAAVIAVVAEAVPGLDRGVHAADPETAAWLAELGFEASAPAPTDLLVTRRFDAAAQAHARRGGRVLVLIEADGALTDAFDYLPIASLGSRDGDGDWVPRQEWLAREGAFAALPGGPLLGIAYEDLLGPLVINGIPAAMRPAQLHSAIFSGWLRHAATTTATVAWSDGEATLTTFRVREQAATSALARTLGRALVEHAARA